MIKLNRHPLDYIFTDLNYKFLKKATDNDNLYKLYEIEGLLLRQNKFDFGIEVRDKDRFSKRFPCGVPLIDFVPDIEDTKVFSNNWEKLSKTEKIIISDLILYLMPNKIGEFEYKNMKIPEGYIFKIFKDSRKLETHDKTIENQMLLSDEFSKEQISGEVLNAIYPKTGKSIESFIWDLCGSFKKNVDIRKEDAITMQAAMKIVGRNKFVVLNKTDPRFSKISILNKKPSDVFIGTRIIDGIGYQAIFLRSMGPNGYEYLSSIPIPIIGKGVKFINTTLNKNFNLKYKKILLTSDQIMEIITAKNQMELLVGKPYRNLIIKGSAAVSQVQGYFVRQCSFRNRLLYNNELQMTKDVINNSLEQHKGE